MKVEINTIKKFHECEREGFRTYSFMRLSKSGYVKETKPHAIVNSGNSLKTYIIKVGILLNNSRLVYAKGNVCERRASEYSDRSGV